MFKYSGFHKPKSFPLLKTIYFTYFSSTYSDLFVFPTCPSADFGIFSDNKTLFLSHDKSILLYAHLKAVFVSLTMGVKITIKHWKL